MITEVCHRLGLTSPLETKYDTSSPKGRGGKNVPVCISSYHVFIHKFRTLFGTIRLRAESTSRSVGQSQLAFVGKHVSYVRWMSSFWFQQYQWVQWQMITRQINRYETFGSGRAKVTSYMHTFVAPMQWVNHGMLDRRSMGKPTKRQR